MTPLINGFAGDAYHAPAGPPKGSSARYRVRVEAEGVRRPRGRRSGNCDRQPVGVAQAAFERILAVHHMSPFDIDEEELAREIAAGRGVGRA